MNFLQRTPFFRIFLALALGILLYQFICLSKLSLILIGLAALVAIIFSFFIKSPENLFKFRWLFGTGIALLLLVLGYWLRLNFDDKNQFTALNDKGIYEVEVVSAPIEKANSYQTKVKLINKVDSISIIPQKGNAVVYFQKTTGFDSTLIIGDKLLVSTEFQTPDGIKNPGGFDYATYLKHQGILATTYVSEGYWKKLNTNPSFSIRRISDRIRNSMLNIYRKFGIKGNEFAVLAALTLGYTDELKPELRQNYSNAGAMHILAISGLHVGIIFVVLNFLLKFMNDTKKKKIIKSVVIIGFLWFYAFITGLSPAVFRATIMFSLVSAAGFLDRKSQIYNTIFFSAFVMLLLKPTSIFEVGFQLSYVAVLSIVFFQPRISKLFYTKNNILKWSWNLIAVSIAAQLGTAPFALFYFHQFPNFFLLTNFIAIPLATFIIYAAIALFIFSWVPGLSLLIAIVLKGLLTALNFSIQAIQGLPLAISSISLDIKQVVFIFIGLIFLVRYAQSKRFTPLFIGLFSIFLVVATFAVKRYSSLTAQKMILFSSYNVPIINLLDKDKNYVITTDSLMAAKTAGNFWKTNFINPPTYIQTYNGFFTFKQKKFFILMDNSWNNKIADNPIKIDILIITNKGKPKIKDILENIYPQQIIVDKSISNWYTNQIKETCKTNHIGFYSVSENGAYILDFQK